MSPTALHLRVAELIELATDGQVSTADALAGDESLATLGLDSLGFLRLIDAIEETYSVEIDLGVGGSWMSSVDTIVAQLVAQGVLTSVSP